MRSMRLAAAAASLVVIGAIAIAGCGGSDDTSSTTAAISKDDFITQANQICADQGKALDAAGKEVFTGGKPSNAEMTGFVNDTMVPTIQSEIDGIAALGAPAGDEDQVNAILDAAQSGLDEVEADPTIFATSNEDPFAEANKLGDEYGITECSGG